MADTAILFPGQGAQDVGMGRDFAEAHPAAARIFDEANDVLGYDLRALCFEGPATELTLTTHAQPAIFTCSAAVVEALRETKRLGPVKMTAGLSLGEYTAFWFAGAFSFADGLKLVKRRGAAMQAASDLVPSGMVSLLGADPPTAQAVADRARGDGVLVVANLNAPGQVVLSGDLAACARVPEVAKELGVRRAIQLAVAGAFHSPLMAPARAELERALSETRIHDPTIPVVSNVTGLAATRASDVFDVLARQVISPVLWESSMRFMHSVGIKRFVEPAPGTVLSGLARKIIPGVEIVPAARAVDLESLA